MTAVAILRPSPARAVDPFLGVLLHKHPDRAQSFNVAGGTAHVVWPEAIDADPLFATGLPRQRTPQAVSA